MRWGILPCVGLFSPSVTQGKQEHAREWWGWGMSMTRTSGSKFCQTFYYTLYIKCTKDFIIKIRKTVMLQKYDSIITVHFYL